jgi:hypothetical protein
LARAQFDEEEDINRLQPNGFDAEEIASQDLISVMIHQLSPAYGTISN